MLFYRFLQNWGETPDETPFFIVVKHFETPKSATILQFYK
ncbi:MAG: hypothetical protein JWP71_3180 [Mucilaginibacter sp.]|nr:hypothetical protein [Mucilaginibacter sp.]